MKNSKVLPEPKPQSLNPSFDKPEFIIFSYKEADEVNEEKLIVYLRNFSDDNYL